jgi:DNA invertase Pin-like site-specific DNA recombinase
MKIGYARVSTEAQNIDMQIEALLQAGCESIYQEKKSAFSKRPELDNAIKSLRDGDTLIVWAFDRLGRNMLEVMANVKEIHDKGANVYSIVHKIDTGTPAGKIMLFNFTLFAEMEATLRKERAQAGIAMARAQGRPLGRRKGLTERTKKIAGLVKQMYLSENPVYSVNQITKELGMSKKTLYKCLEHAGVSLRGGLDIQ